MYNIYNTVEQCPLLTAVASATDGEYVERIIKAAAQPLVALNLPEKTTVSRAIALHAKKVDTPFNVYTGTKGPEVITNLNRDAWKLLIQRYTEALALREEEESSNFSPLDSDYDSGWTADTPAAYATLKHLPNLTVITRKLLHSIASLNTSAKTVNWLSAKHSPASPRMKVITLTVHPNASEVDILSALLQAEQGVFMSKREIKAPEATPVAEQQALSQEALALNRALSSLG